MVSPHELTTSSTPPSITAICRCTGQISACNADALPCCDISCCCCNSCCSLRCCLSTSTCSCCLSCCMWEYMVARCACRADSCKAGSTRQQQHTTTSAHSNSSTKQQQGVHSLRVPGYTSNFNMHVRCCAVSLCCLNTETSRLARYILPGAQAQLQASKISGSRMNESQVLHSLRPARPAHACRTADPAHLPLPMPIGCTDAASHTRALPSAPASNNNNRAATCIMGSWWLLLMLLSSHLYLSRTKV